VRILQKKGGKSRNTPAPRALGQKNERACESRKRERPLRALKKKEKKSLDQKDCSILKSTGPSHVRRKGEKEELGRGMAAARSDLNKKREAGVSRGKEGQNQRGT